MKAPSDSNFRALSDGMLGDFSRLHLSLRALRGELAATAVNAPMVPAELAFPIAVLEHKYIKLICTGYLDSATVPWKNSEATVVLPYLVPVSCFSSLYFVAGSLLILLLGLREIDAADMSSTRS
ncbi:hypothetical protein Tco_0294731 [Tanacetum coccineum]